MTSVCDVESYVPDSIASAVSVLPVYPRLSDNWGIVKGVPLAWPKCCLFRWIILSSRKIIGVYNSRAIALVSAIALLLRF